MWPQIIAAVQKVFELGHMLVSDWSKRNLGGTNLMNTDQMLVTRRAVPGILEFVTTHPLYAAAVEAAMLIFWLFVLLVIMLVLLSIWFGPAPLLSLLSLLRWLAQRIVRCLGFGIKGVIKGSWAAFYQSTRLAGHIPVGSVFAWLQSFGASTF